ILNVTPDSFSDGGEFLEPDKAVAHAAVMARQGADIIDVGAESTRPYGGAVPVSAEDEKRRLLPILPAVVRLGVPVSIDTIRHRLRPGRSIKAQPSSTTCGASSAIR